MSDDSENGGDYDLEGYRSEDSLDSDADNGFFEMEAVESGDSDESDNDSSSSDESEPSSPIPVDSPYFTGPTTFPQFMQLPPELRHQIWELFCPDLVAKSRVYELVVDGRDEYPEDGPFLQQQTAPARAVLATHRESRAFALRTLPDTFPIGAAGGVVRFNQHSDIVYLHGKRPDFQLLENLIRTFDTIRHLAIPQAEWQWIPLKSYRDMRSCFPNLEALYLHIGLDDHGIKEVDYLKNHRLKSYMFQTFELEPGLGEDLDFVYCWPDLADDAEVISTVPLLEDDEDDGTRREIPVYPLVQLDFDFGVEWFDRLMKWKQHGGNWDSSMDGFFDSDGSGSETNEYESEGIDDEDIVDDAEQSEDEDDLAVQFDDGAMADHISISSSDNDTNHDGAELTEYPPATFSSPESGTGSSATLEGGGLDSSESEDDAAPMTHRPKRRIVSSDDEDGSDAEPTTRSRPMKRARVMSDSEEEDVEKDESDVGQRKSERPTKRARVVLSDSEDSGVSGEGAATKEPSSVTGDDSSDDEPVTKAGRPSKRAQVISSHSEDDSGSSEGSGDSESSDDSED